MQERRKLRRMTEVLLHAQGAGKGHRDRGREARGSDRTRGVRGGGRDQGARGEDRALGEDQDQGRDRARGVPRRERKIGGWINWRLK